MNSLNPEFKRQLWLNWRPSLLAWSLGLSLLVLALPIALSSPKDLPGSLSATAIAGLWIATSIYGSVLAGRSLAEEASQNTWDWQRLSALSPWQMAWGKLIGAALPAWLYALWFAIAIAGIATVWVLEQLSVVHMVGLAVLWGLGLQTWAMNSVLMSWGQHDSPVNRRRAALLPLLLLFFIPGPFLGRVYDNIFNSNDEAVLWWGLDVGGLGIAYLAGALVLALGLLGLWRMLCARLDVRTLPWAWPLGIVVTGIFAGGTFNGGLNAFLGCTAWIALLGTVYVALQHMDQHLRAWRQVQWSLSRGRLREALEALPLWPVSLLLGLIASLLVALRPSPLEAEIASALGSLSVLMYLQLLRDCLLLTGFALLVGKLKSPMVSFVIAWLILNVAAPLLAYGVAGMKGAMFIQPVIAQWVGGLDSTEQVWVGLVPWVSLGLQILAVLAWVIYIFQERVLGFARSNAAARI
ncbi:hypothetical protein DZC30_11825 [Comamonas testosteroni]|uniref:Uncharacterized protein n=1 Tax=Comamonas testosteroni TaxID=285 RepID=A0A373FKS0_COMTE|nr:hypothetical protein [Comamonas testosteroni]RGE44781.1 hypothetical protein DZC30_11825 [Comamonas testosteroni]